MRGAGRDSLSLVIKVASFDSEDSRYLRSKCNLSVGVHRQDAIALCRWALAQVEEAEEEGFDLLQHAFFGGLPTVACFKQRHRR